jgi:hypothetical protein
MAKQKTAAATKTARKRRTIAANRNVRVTLETVTPEMALEWLTNQADNRNLRQQDVKVMAEDMIAGRWENNGDTIKFHRDGRLVDGQHRLYAVIEAEVNVPMLIAENLDDAALATIDTGRGRKIHDLMKILGDKLHSPLAASCATMMIVGTNQANIARIASKTSAIEFMNLHRAPIEFTMEAFPRRVKFITNQAVLGAFARAYYTYTSEEARERMKRFAATLLTGMMDKGDEAAVVLRNYLTATNEPKSVVYLKVEKAISSFMDYETIERLYPAKRELFPLPEER